MNCLSLLNFLSLLSHRHILLAHYLLKQIHHDYYLIRVSIRVLEIKTSMLFNLDFADITILSCIFFFLLIIELYFLIPAAIAQIFNPIAKLIKLKYIQYLQKLK